jgi:hypothetical protein
MNRLRKIMYLGPIHYVMWASARGKWPHRQHLLSSERANRYNESVTHVAKIVIRFCCFSPHTSQVRNVLWKVLTFELVTFDILQAVTIKLCVVCHGTPCSVVELYRRCRGT